MKCSVRQVAMDGSVMVRDIFVCSEELGGNVPLCDEQDRFVGCYRHKIGGVDTISTILLARYRHDQILP